MFEKIINFDDGSLIITETQLGYFFNLQIDKRLTQTTIIQFDKQLKIKRFVFAGATGNINTHSQFIAIDHNSLTIGINDYPLAPTAFWSTYLPKIFI